MIRLKEYLYMYSLLINIMHLLTYQAKHLNNLYRLCSIGGHTSEDLSHAFDYIFAEPHTTLGIILDIQNGLSLFPKEGPLFLPAKPMNTVLKPVFLRLLSNKTISKMCVPDMNYILNWSSNTST